MRSNLLPAALLCVATLCPLASRGQDAKTKPPPAAKLAKPDVYYAKDETLKEKVRLSDEMAAMLIEIIERKPKPFVRTITAAPRGYFVVGQKAYAFYGFIASDASKGDAWDDPVLYSFWDELNRVKDELGPLRDFTPMPGMWPISEADSIFAVYREDHGLASNGEPAVILVAWMDGRIVWSTDRLKGGAP